MLAKDLKVGDKIYRVCHQMLGIFEITKIITHNNNIYFDTVAIIDPVNLFGPYFTYEKDSEVYIHTDTFMFTANEQEAVEFLREQLKNVS